MMSTARTSLTEWHIAERTQGPEFAVQSQWYALQTSARHEKSVGEQLCRKRIECFVPLCERISQWKDRRVRIREPLFDGYVFVRIAPQDRLRTLQVRGAVRLVGFGRAPQPIDDFEITSLRERLENGVIATPHPYLEVGDRIQIRSGPLSGFQGILIRRRGEWRLVLSIELLRRSIVVDIDEADVIRSLSHSN